MKSKVLIYTLALSILLSGGILFSAPKSSSSSRSSSSSSRSSSGSKYSTPKSSAPKPSAPSAPKYSTPKPSAPSAPKPSAPSTPKYSTPKPSASSSTSKPVEVSPKLNAYSKIPASNSAIVPPAAPLSEKARAAKEQQSQRKYQETVKANTPPKKEYINPNTGKTVNVRTDSKHVESIRNQPSTNYTPQARQKTVNVHVNNYQYRHPSDWYYSQPTVYVGGGYSSAFWWMMMEWDAERRARWLYNNRSVIERDAYERGIKDAEVARQIAILESQKTTPNSDYIDPEFAKDPSLMYDDAYIAAAYNPKPTPSASSGVSVLTTILILAVVAFGLYVLIFKIRWGAQK